MVERFERFSAAIFEISRCWHRIAGEEMAKFGLKGPHAVYLVTMQRYPDGITAAQLCELCGRDKADISRAVSLMVQKQLITKEGSQYRARLLLTPEGDKAAAQVCHAAATAVELASKGYSHRQRDIFYQVLDTITANLQTLSQQGLPKE